MNQSFYIGAGGASQFQQRLNVQGDNIANVNSHGFKASSGRFASLMYANMVGIDDAQLPAGTGANMMMTTTNFRSGPISSTGRMQDYYIDGRGFFAVVDMATNEISLTRNGAFSMAEYQRPTGETDENGQPVLETIFCLSDGQGRFVLSDRGGLIEMTDSNEKQPVGIFDCENYDGIGRLQGTRVLPGDKQGGLWMGTGKLVNGALEMSNVDLAEEITKVIESQRAYGMALKVVQTSDEIETTINGLRS